MREIGEFDQEKLALRFWNYLNKEGIESSLEEDDENNQCTEGGATASSSATKVTAIADKGNEDFYD